MTNGIKDIVLIYHVYHAKQPTSIHDWEWIEIRLHDVGLTPKHEDIIKYIVITEHSKHNAPTTYTSKDLNFHLTGNGKHPLIYQAGCRNLVSFQKGKLHYVENTAKTIKNRSEAVVDVNGSGKIPYHYIFVNQSDNGAINYWWNAQKITPSNAAFLSHGIYSQINTSQVKTTTIWITRSCRYTTFSFNKWWSSFGTSSKE
jgi:hypothetical protein